MGHVAARAAETRSSDWPSDGHMFHPIVQGRIKMCKCIKFAFAVLLVAAAVLAVFDLTTAELLVLKTAEGVLGGLLLGLLAALDLWVRLHHHRGFTLRRFRCLLMWEVRAGVCSGFLIGLVLSLVTILTR
jgi:hypothetical protein